MASTDTAPKLVRWKSLARQCGVSTAVLESWHKAGLARIRIGKYMWVDPADVEAFLQRHRETAAAGK